VPIALSGETLDPFDVVMVGAPEELTAAETAALDSFARRRGGTVVFIADRKPSGPYVRLTGADAFEEALVEKPVRLNTGEGPGIRASEFVYPRTLPLGSEAMATIPHGTGSRAPLISMPLGAGRIVFSGLLDAWRYRGDDGDAFGAFWRSQIGREAIRAPRRLEVTVHPELVAPGHPVRIRAAIRGTDLEASGSLVAVPWITAKSVDDRGSQQFVRLWPTAEPGVFEGKLIAPRTGRYDVRVETGAGTSADVPVVVSDAGSPKTVDTNLVMPGAIARATGGVVVSQSNIDPLVIHLRGLQRGEVAAVRHPMGSPLWAVAFVALLSAEWFARRRRGLR
jgi:hypothetical protein